MSDPGTILVVVLGVPGALGLLLAVLSGLEDSLSRPPTLPQAPAVGSDRGHAGDAAARP